LPPKQTKQEKKQTTGGINMEDFQDLMGGKKNVLSETNKQQLQEFEKMQKDLRAK
jgi:hypothetical protein